MTLTPGSRLGPFEVVALLGVGGMGEVYRATDSNLKRQVAIKVLPLTVSGDPERLARFQREAEVLAALNHPNIAHIHGLERAGGTIALVMELVEGPTLAERIDGLRSQGGMPLAEALPIATQIAEALEAAHEQGIIHRDLKPANIKVRDDGTVKVLDFGLAKALDAPGAAGAASGAGVSLTPTITTPAMMTGVGMILGTAAYMSPEQAKGRPADKRADVWAFGCVLYEMLAGKRAFEGEDVAETMAAVLRAEPDWSALSGVPPRIRTIVQRSLTKDRKTRIPDISVVRFLLADGLLPEAEAPSASPLDRAPGAGVLSRLLPWSIATVAATTALLLWAPWRAVPVRSPVRLSAAPATDVTLLSGALGPAIVLSPDDRTLAIVGISGPHDPPRIFVRRLDQLQATPLAGTENAVGPFYSPDGRRIAFFSNGKLKTIAAAGGSVVTVANAGNPRGGSWGDDGSIVFAPETQGTLLRVSADGGNAVPATALAGAELSHRWPQMLPGGKAVLYSASDSPTAWAQASLVVQPLPAGPVKVVQKRGLYGRYLPNGYLVFVRDGVLFGAPFDLGRLEFTRAPAPVLEGIAAINPTGAAAFTFSPNGTVAYVAGPTTTEAAPVAWIGRDGQTTVLRATASDWASPQFSPDGSRLALDISDGTNTDVFVYDWARDALSRLTFDPGVDQKPVWTPDGHRIAFSSTRADGTTLNLYWQRADGGGDAQRLTTSANAQLTGSWHPSGKYLAFSEIRPDTRSDLMILPMAGDDTNGWRAGTPTVFLSTPALESEPVFSPDGRWIAYQSNESGTNQVYVRPFPGPGGKWQLSDDGGSTPTWSRTRPELLYRSLRGNAMAVPYAVKGDSFAAEKPRLWSPVPLVTRSRSRYFDLHSDGERIAATPPPASAQSAPLDRVVFVFNFFDELKRLAPPK